MKTIGILAAAALVATAAGAHDTWFERLPAGAAGDLRLALGTGNRFPAHEVTVGAASLVAGGCRQRDGAPLRLRVQRDTERALLLRSTLPVRAAGGVSCWAQQMPFEVELEPALVDLYLDEIAAPAAVRQAWRSMQSRGVPWRERYRKHARIEVFDGDAADAAGLPFAPAPIGLDIVVDGAQRPLSAGEPIAFRVLRDGEPLKHFAVELRSDRSAFGIWLRTDDEGRSRVPLPFAGRWCLRGTELRPSADDPDRWESRFVTLAFEVAAAAR